MKKLISLLGAGALLAAMVVPAFAAWNMANVKNTTVSGATTGLSAVNSANVSSNLVNGSVVVGGVNGVSGSYTGAATAKSVGVVVANTDVSPCLTCNPFGNFNVANVDNGVGATADTSMYQGNIANVSSNLVGGFFVPGSVVVGGSNGVSGSHTGVGNATSVGVVVVNTQLSGFMFP